MEQTSYAFGDDWMLEEHLVVAGQDARKAKWAVGTALDCRRRATVVAVYDLDDIASGPVASARLPYALPLGLHGTFLAQTS